MHELTELVARHGLSLVFLNVFLTQVGVPVPAMPLLVIAGALLADGTIHLVPLTIVVVIASLLGDLPWYYAGRRYGYRILRTVCRVAIEPDSCVKQTENIFMRFGPSSLMVAKYIPGFATVAPPLAGTMRLSLARFVTLSAAAAFLWAALPVAGGALFRRQVDWLLQALSEMGMGALATLGVIVLVYVTVKLTERYLLIRFLRMVRVGVDELKEMLGAEPPPIILDARSPLAREAEPRRIPGALPIALDAAEEIVDSLPTDRDVIVYCS